MRPILFVLLGAVTAGCSVPGVDFTELDGGDDVDAVDAPPGGLALVVSASTVTVSEGAEASFTVVLPQAPAGAVFVAVQSSDEVVLGSRPDLLVFEAVNWDQPQTVTLSGKDDADALDEIAGVTLTSAAAGDASVQVVVDDDDALRVVTTPAASLEVDEGATTTVAVKLSAIPAGDVVLEVGSLDPASAAVAPGTLTFTPVDWDTAQDVLVTGVQDDDTEHEDTSLTFGAPGSPDVDGATLAVRVVDDEVLNIVPSVSNLGTLIEGGTTSFTVRLSYPPPADLDVAVASSDPSALAVSPAALRFTTSNWSTPQTVTVEAPQDQDVVDETPAVTLTTAATMPRTIAVAIDDDDEQEVLFAPATVAVVENATAALSVHLRYEPAAPVTVTVASAAATVATVTPASLVFTPGDYAQPQVVTVRGAEDQDAAAAMTAVRLESLSPPLTADVPVTVADNDVLHIETDVTAVSLTETTTATFQVRLTAAPVSTLAVTPLSSDVTAVTVSPATLSFTASNWNAYQTVTVTGVDDVDAAADTVILSLTSAATPAVTVTATVTDVDQQAIVASPATSVSVDEGATATIGVRLQHQPSSNVIVAVSSSATAAATVAPATLTFSPTNYATNQTVTVTGVDDVDTASATAVVTLASAGLASVPIEVAVTDNDVLAIDLDVASLSISEGASGAIRVRLSAQPPGTVTVSASSSDTGAATVMPASLSFSAATWNTPQTLTVTGVDDADVAGESVTITLTSPGIPPRTAEVAVTDDDVLGVVTTPATIALGEAGSATFQARLSRAPASNVTVGVASSDPGAATVAPTSLTFSPQTWDTYQTVTVTGVADVDLANEAITIDLTGANVTPAAVAAAITDDDMQVVTVASGSIVVTEGGSGTVGVRLQYQPSTDVVVTASSANAAITTVSPATLTFTPASYATPQPLTIAGVDDPDAAPGTTTVSLTSPGATGASIAVTVTDDDPLGVATSMASMIVGEQSSSTLGVRLTAQPSANVTISVSSSDSGAATVSPSTLTFTPANWDAYQNVTIAGVDDADAADETVSVTCSGTGVITRTVSVTVDDDDQLTIIASTSSVSMTEGGIATFTVRLGAQPQATTAVAVTSADAGAVTVSPSSLSFTTANWATSQTVTVTGVDDLDMAAESVALSLTAGGLDPVTVTASVTDPDVQRVLASPATLTVGEGATGTVTVSLAHEPAANTTVTVSVAASIATASASTLTFTPTNYATAQTLTITGTQDADAVDDTTSLSLTSTGATPAAVALTIDDDESLTFVTSATMYTVFEGATATVQVRLSAQPTSTVTVGVTSTDTSAATVSPGTLTFTTSNWSTYQTVTVTGVQDADSSNDYPDVRFASSGYTSVDVEGLAYDNDTIVTDLSSLALYEQGSATLQVRLTAPPPASVTVAVVSSDTNTATLSVSTRTFTTSNWNTYQLVPVSGVNDADVTNDAVNITLSSTGYTTRTVPAVVHDNDTIAPEVSQLSVAEYETLPLRVRLAAQPIGNVVVSATMSASGVVSRTPSTLTFTPSDWSTYQTVSVTGSGDADTDNDVVTMSFSATGLSTATTTITAVETLQLAVLPYSDNGGAGTITGPGINCSVGSTGTCSARYRVGTTVTLTATGGPSSAFWHWDYCPQPSGDTCTVVMNQGVTTGVHAYFPRVVSLTVTKTGNGTVVDQWNALNCGSVCSWAYHWVATVGLTATPAAGWSFSHWTGACAGQGASCTATFDVNTTTHAVFTSP